MARSIADQYASILQSLERSYEWFNGHFPEDRRLGGFVALADTTGSLMLTAGIGGFLEYGATDIRKKASERIRQLAQRTNLVTSWQYKPIECGAVAFPLGVIGFAGWPFQPPLADEAIILLTCLGAGLLSERRVRYLAAISSNPFLASHSGFAHE